MLFVKNGIPDRLMLNEACSAGCGSFIENFAQGLGLTRVNLPSWL